MHLLAATPGTIADGTEPVDPGQSPAELVVISAADSEIATLAEARALLGEAAPGLRLINIAHLAHPYSVDLHLEQCATHARLVVARVLGGMGYWRYGVEQYSARLREAGVKVAFLPGDDQPDAELAALSTIAAEDYRALHRALSEGGIDNAVTFLRHARAMIDDTDRPPPPRPLVRAGLWWPGDGAGQLDLEALRRHWPAEGAIVPVVFYRALLQGGGLGPVADLVAALRQRNLAPLPIFVASLKDPVSAAFLADTFTEAPPEVILNLTSFATGTPHEEKKTTVNPLAGPAANGAPVLQVILASTPESFHDENPASLVGRDIAMNVALPEIDGRVLARAIAFKGEARFDPAVECAIATWKPRADRIAFVADLAARWARLRRKHPAERRVAIVLANYPNRDGRLANGVGLDTPAATVKVMQALAAEGYRLHDAPADAEALMARLLAGPTNWLTDRFDRQGGVDLPLADYMIDYGALPEELRHAVEDRWGAPEADPFFVPGETDCGRFHLSIHPFGNVVVGIQPARGYNIDPKDTYHSPDLVPPHNYLAFHFWLRHHFGADAVLHMGKHGNLEWLPGKAVALEATCWPEAALGPLPHIYPFIVNDPGEGTQAKRRAQAVIIDHLTPPLTRAESYGPLRDLEALVDEYYEAAGVDPRRRERLKDEIVTLCEATGIATDAGLSGEDAEADLARLDAWLCDLKEAQIRDGLHVFGTSPEGRQARDLVQALVRIPRGDGNGGNASLIRVLAADLGLDFDPLDCDMAAPWRGSRPALLAALAPDPWRSAGDTVERLEILAAKLIEGWRPEGWPRGWSAGAAVMEEVERRVKPLVAHSGTAEMAGLLAALDGRFVPPGPSGAPTRGRLDVLPTGRNFYSVDSRAVPTPTAWALGWKSASLLVEAHLQRTGDWPKAMLVTAWGTSNMRTGGDDIAQALALMGVRPTWDSANRRVTGFEILPLEVLGRPRVDVTLRISGFFRDAFPQLVALVDSAAKAVMELDEPDEMNPAAAHYRAEGRRTEAAWRVFGARPGAYGAGLQALIDERLWERRADLAESWLEWGGWAYGAAIEGIRARDALATRMTRIDAIVQNQDNREHDLLDSDDYYQFEGGAAATAETLQGRAPIVWHNDHSRPERPVIRTLEEEISRVIRARVVNPKWIDGVKRHGYKGAFEIAATVDYLFAFAATTHAVKNHHFDLVHQAFLEDEETRDFIARHNPAALREIAERLSEAMARGLWRPRLNSARTTLDAILAGGGGKTGGEKTGAPER